LGTNPQGLPSARSCWVEGGKEWRRERR